MGSALTGGSCMKSPNTTSVRLPNGAIQRNSSLLKDDGRPAGEVPRMVVSRWWIFTSMSLLTMLISSMIRHLQFLNIWDSSYEKNHCCAYNYLLQLLQLLSGDLREYSDSTLLDGDAESRVERRPSDAESRESRGGGKDAGTLSVLVRQLVRKYFDQQRLPRSSWWDVRSSTAKLLPVPVMNCRSCFSDFTRLSICKREKKYVCPTLPEMVFFAKNEYTLFSYVYESVLQQYFFCNAIIQ